MKEDMGRHGTEMDLVELLHSTREAQSDLVAVSSPEHWETLQRESLDRFRARLPSLREEGKERPTHPACVRKSRHLRARKGHFEGVLRDVLGWVVGSAGQSSFRAIRRCQPENAATQGEGLVGRIGQRLVYAVLDHPVPGLYITPELAPVEQQRKGSIPVTASGEATDRQSQWSLTNRAVRLQLVILGRFKLVARTTLGNCNYPRSLGPSMEEAWPQRPLDQPLEEMLGLPVLPHQPRRRLETLFRPPAGVFSRPIPSVR